MNPQIFWSDDSKTKPASPYNNAHSAETQNTVNHTDRRPKLMNETSCGLKNFLRDTCGRQEITAAARKHELREINKNQQRAACIATEGMRTDRESPMKTTRNWRLHASGRSGPLMVHFDRRHKSERKKSSCAKRSRAEQPDHRVKGEKHSAAEPLRGTEYCTK
jgi:hypothetical protein